MLWINAASVPSVAAERCALPWASIPYTIERTEALRTGIPPLTELEVRTWILSKPFKK